jgi:MFS family permease
MNAAFSIGAALAVPLVPYVNDRFGRKACIVVGSTIITIGAILQTASVDGLSITCPFYLVKPSG